MGLAAAKMTDKQRDLLQKLLKAYADRMPPDIAAVELARVKEAGLDKVHFAYQGGLEQGEKHTYRVQGPTFVVEFLNVQADSAKNPANHIHSALAQPEERLRPGGEVTRTWPPGERAGSIRDRPRRGIRHRCRIFRRLPVRPLLLAAFSRFSQSVSHQSLSAAINFFRQRP